MDYTSPISSLAPLSEDMKAQQKNLIVNEEERQHFIRKILLQNIAEKIMSKSSEIIETIAGKKNARKSVLNIVQTEICNAIDGNMTVTHYSQRAKAEQDVYLFDGTQWIELEHQQYFDFISECSKKCGVTDEYIGEPAFQNDLCERVARTISKHRNPYIPSSEIRVNMQNGTLVVDAEGNKTLREHCRDDFFTYNVGYMYDPQAECPLWHKFLDKVLPNLDAQRILAEYIAYIFTSNLNLEKMLVLHGPGSNGKSVILDTIESLVGSVNVSNVSLAELTKDDEKRSQLEYKLVNISHESDEELQTSALKTIVSNEPISVRQLYVGTHKMTTYAKLVTSFNSLPRAEQTHGFYRRFLILPLNVTISEKEADTDLSKKLRNELSGIINWVLDAMQGLIRRRAFSPCKVCDEALYKYKTASNSAYLFYTQCCELSDHMTTHGTTLYESYKKFCYEEGLHYLGKNKFYEQFEQIEDVKRDEKQRVIFFNITLTGNGNAAPF